MPHMKMMQDSFADGGSGSPVAVGGAGGADSAGPSRSATAAGGAHPPGTAESGARPPGTAGSSSGGGGDGALMDTQTLQREALAKEEAEFLKLESVFISELGLSPDQLPDFARPETAPTSE